MKGACFIHGRKYSTETKLEIVQRYLKGDISQKELANKYGVASKAKGEKLNPPLVFAKRGTLFMPYYIK